MDRDRQNVTLYDGIPIISKGKRGRKGTWNKKRPPAKSKIHINSHNIKYNGKHKNRQKPVIAVKGKEKGYVTALEIPVPCRIVYKPDKPLSCGAKVWIETYCPDLLTRQPANNVISYEVVS